MAHRAAAREAGRSLAEHRLQTRHASARGALELPFRHVQQPHGTVTLTFGQRLRRPDKLDMERAALLPMPRFQ
jgi:hypothetical protein